MHDKVFLQSEFSSKAIKISRNILPKLKISVNLISAICLAAAKYQLKMKALIKQRTFLFLFKALPDCSRVGTSVWGGVGTGG